MTYKDKEKRKAYEKAFQKEYRLKNRDKLNFNKKEYNLKNKDRAKAQFLKRKYNITPEQLQDMYEEQNYTCKTCPTHKDETPRGLYIDHCHKTYEVRGLLCQDCNSMLGFAKDNPEILLKGAEYLKTKGKFN